LPVQGNLSEELSVDIRPKESKGGTIGEGDVSLERMILNTQLRNAQDKIREQRARFDYQHPVDEYIYSWGFPASNTATFEGGYSWSGSIMVQRAWDMPEKIESFIAVLPVGTVFAVAKLGDRYIPVYPPAGEAVGTPVTPAVPASTIPVQNANDYPVNVTISAGTLTAVTVNGVVVGSTDGTYLVPAAGTISVTYTVAPTWVWTDAAQAVTAPLTISKDGIGAILGQDDDRVLLIQGAFTAGPCGFELMGFADEIWGNA
jgi:hypothetical protein